MNEPKPREIACAVLFDKDGHVLLQQRDNFPDILFPGKAGLFGGHREGDETFLQCVVREIHEELSYYLPPERFESIASRFGPDIEVAGGTVKAEFYVVRDVTLENVKVTEGSLKMMIASELSQLDGKLTPVAQFALVRLGLLPA
jgi:8-oxo-dGTP diphosphatase